MNHSVAGREMERMRKREMESNNKIWDYSIKILYIFYDMGSSLWRGNFTSIILCLNSLYLPPPSSHLLPHILMPSNDGENNKKKLIIVFARRNKWKKTRNSYFPIIRRGELEVTPKPQPQSQPYRHIYLTLMTITTRS